MRKGRDWERGLAAMKKVQNHTLAVVGGAAVAGVAASAITVCATKKMMETAGDVISRVADGAVDKAQDVMSINTKLIAAGVGCMAALTTAACINSVAKLAKAGKNISSHIKVPHL